jgi:hypothetical protein
MVHFGSLDPVATPPHRTRHVGPAGRPWHTMATPKPFQLLPILGGNIWKVSTTVLDWTWVGKGLIVFSHLIHYALNQVFLSGHGWLWGPRSSSLICHSGYNDYILHISAYFWRLVRSFNLSPPKKTVSKHTIHRVNCGETSRGSVRSERLRYRF